MLIYFRYILVLFFAASFTSSSAQRVTVSKEMNIRNDVAYDIIGHIEDNVLLYRDKGNERLVEVFDKDMKHLFDREIILARRKADVYAIEPQDTAFTIIYGYRDKRLYNMKAHKYDSFGKLIDSVTYLNNIENFKIEYFQFEVSEDRSKTLLFSTRKNDLFYSYVIDNDNMELLWRKESKLIGFDVRKDFRGIVLSNLGEVNALFEVDNSKFDKETHHMILLGLDSSDGLFENVFTLKNKLTVDLEMDYDNINKRIILAGLVSDESEFDATGYFYLSKEIATLETETIIKDYDFDLTFLGELYGKKLSKKKKLNDFVTRDLVLRGDGGFLLFAEMNKEYYRRSAFNGG